MTSPRESYRRACENMSIFPNSGVLRTLPETNGWPSNLSLVSLLHNFLGNRGILPLLTVLADATFLHTLDLRENGIGNSGVKAICRALRHHSSLQVLELSGNPFTYLAARGLVRLCEDCPSLTFIGIEDTLMTESLKNSIYSRLEKVLERRDKCKMGSNLKKKENNIGLSDQTDVNVVDNQSCALPLPNDVPSCESAANCAKIVEDEPQESILPVVKVENLIQSPPLTPSLTETQKKKKYAIWMDDEFEEEEEGENEQQIDKINKEVRRKSVEDQNNSRLAANISEDGNTSKTTRSVIQGSLHSLNKPLQEDVLILHDSNAGNGDLITPLCAYKPFLSQPLLEERMDVIAGASGVSSLTLEVRSALAKGKIEEMESMVKEDEFLDFFSSSNVE